MHQQFRTRQVNMMVNASEEEIVEYFRSCISKGKVKLFLNIYHTSFIRRFLLVSRWQCLPGEIGTSNGKSAAARRILFRYPGALGNERL
jgi:hypothetical protein